jgi:hypothetical protein
MPYFSLRAEAPKTEAILRKTTQDLQEGKPDFSTMEPELQNAVKEQAQHTAEIYQTGKISLLLLQPAFPWE